MKKMVFGAAALGTAVLGTACTAGAVTLFNRVIPRQDVLRVDLNEMADMAKWEEYKKVIAPNKEWLFARELEHITIRSRDGLTLHGEFLPAEYQSNKLAICGQGYTGCGLKDSVSIAVFFHRMGYNCLIVDHRAHGKSEGDYVGFGILDRFDMKAWIDCMEKRFEGNAEIVLYGVS